MFDERFWDEYMTRYDEAVATLDPYRSLIERCVEWGQPRPGERVLDLGCGTGNLLRRVADSSAGVRSYGVERSTRAAAITADKLAGRDASLFVADLDELRWRDALEASGAPVDLAFMVNVLYDLRDPAAVLRALRRVIRVGGRLIISNPHDPRPQLLLDAHDAWRASASPVERALDDRYAPARRWMLDANSKIAHRAKARELHFLQRQDMITLLNGAGFLVTRLDERAYAGVNLLLEAQRVW